MANKQNVWRVADVQVGDETLPVKFKLHAPKQQIWVAAPGKRMFSIRKANDLFYAVQRGQQASVKATHPAEAFALGVHTFWGSEYDNDEAPF